MGIWKRFWNALERKNVEVEADYVGLPVMLKDKYGNENMGEGVIYINPHRVESLLPAPGRALPPKGDYNRLLTATTLLRTASGAEHAILLTPDQTRFQLRGKHL